MKTNLRLLGALLALLPLGAQAQGVCGNASYVYDFTTAAAQTWQARSATLGLTTFTTSDFSSTGSVATFRTEDWARNDQRLVWEADYAAKDGTSTVTFTFSRAVLNFKIVVSDIDRNVASGNGNDFQDAVTFNGYTDNGALIDLGTCTIDNSRALTRLGNTITDATTENNRDGTTTITFSQAVKRLVLVYSNNAQGDINPGNQAIGINSLTWCKLKPTAANDALTTSYRANPVIDLSANDVVDGGPITLDLNPAQTGVQSSFTDANGVSFTASAGTVSVINSNKYVGSTTLPYTLIDNAGQTANASLALTLTNAAPVANDYQVTRSYIVATGIDLKPSITDADGEASIKFASLDLNPSLANRQVNYTIPNQGTFTVDDDGVVKFVASNGFVGTSALSYTISDEKGLTSAVKQLRLTTTSAAPVANNDVATSSNTARSVSYILNNDTDADNDIDPATVDLIPSTTTRDVSYTDAGKGTYTVDEFGLISFTALNGYVGSSTLSYRVRDARGTLSNTATLALTVTQTLLNNDSNITPQNTVVRGNVLINDNNSAGTSLVVTGVTNRATPHGTVTILSNGNYTYTPSSPYIGNDAFEYEVVVNGVSSKATVNIRVYDPNAACTQATGPNLLKNPDFSLGNTGFQTDYGYVANDPTKTTELNPEGLYAVGTNAAEYHGNFAQLGRGESGNFLMINGSNSIKKLYSQTIKVEPNKYYSFSAYVNNILANTTTATTDDPVFGFVINGASTSGITSVPEDPNTWVKLGNIWFSGDNTTATFEIVNVSTEAGGNDMGIDDVHFGTCNVAPVAMNDLVLAPSVVPTAFSSIINDVDDGGIQGSTVVLYPSGNTTGAGSKNLTVANEGTYSTNTTTGMITFTPVTGFTGSSTIAYKGNDGASATSNVATVTVRVGPITTNDAQNMAGKRVATLDITANDVDVDGVDATTVDLNPATPEQDLNRVIPNVGIFQVNNAGVVTFTPAYTFSGTTSIDYIVYDFVGAPSNISSISVTLPQPLPVELTKFGAVAKGTAALVSWETAMEKNSDHFDIERSVDGSAFVKVGAVKGQGSTTQKHNYTFLDNNARKAGSLVYYRLRQVDTDGSFQYSAVSTVTFAEALGADYTVALEPNPASSTTTLNLTSLPAGNYTVDLIDVTGRVLHTGLVTGGSFSPLALHTLAKGVYIVVVHNNAIRVTQRLVKE